MKLPNPLVVVWLAGCVHPAPGQAPTPLNADAVAGVTDPRLQHLLSDQWERAMIESPTGATGLGDHRYDDRLDVHSQAANAAARAARDGFLARAEGLPAASLNAADAVTLELFAETLRTGQGTDICQTEQWGLSARNNALTMAAALGELQPLVTMEDAANYLARVRALRVYITDDAANLRLGIAQGRTPNAASVRLVIEQVDTMLATPVEEWATAVPLKTPHPDWTPGVEADFHSSVIGMLTAVITPELRTYREFLQAELLPVARGDDRVGVWALPDGDACYQALILAHTSLPLKAPELHATGLSELASIHAEMQILGQKLFGTSDLPTLFARLRTDPTLRFSTADEILAKANANLAAAKARIPAFFGRLPVADCEVRPIPDYEAPYTYVAYYRQLVPGEQPGYYYVNTYQPETRPRFEASVLAFHESIPGHHLQIAIARELPTMPAFRKNLAPAAFEEGWALYTERLADEMGLYATDLDRLGMLSFDSWRASRLVVDTGIHSLHWDRAQAERFMMDNTPLAANNIHNEVDRYITWPGQALAYKTGQITIRDLRKEAEAKMGDRFSLPAFHDVVLGSGAVTLPVLQRQVRAWEEGK